MLCKMVGSRLAMLYALGWPVRKLSLEETASPSKKNWVVISFPSSLIQVRRQPFSIKYMVRDTCPSCRRVVLAEPFIGLNQGLNRSQGVGCNFSCFNAR